MVSFITPITIDFKRKYNKFKKENILTLGFADGDGWSDYMEIYETMSNPLSRDSDADGAIDSTDIDPLHNVIIEVEVEEAKMHDSSVAEHLQVVIIDRSTDNAIFTTQKRKNSIRISTWDDKFYFDIDDDRTNFRINCELYDVNKALWDTKIMDINYKYDEIFDDLSGGSSTYERLENSAGNYVEFRLKPIRLSRVNTIAVYENGTFSHGRYNTQEKMTMIQLDICPEPNILNFLDSIDIPEESPFMNGANVILIPSSVFINSKLNAVIQQAVVPDEDEEVNWSAVPDCLKNKEVTLRIGSLIMKVDTTEFIGLDRSDPDESVSNWIEMTIVKRYCSLEDAEAILELALTTEINETTHEEAITYLYNSTKGHTELELSPERMNLHKDILKIIPLDGEDYRNARQGSKPEEFDDYVHKLVSNFINLIKGLIMAIGRFIANIVKAIIKIGLSFLAAITAALLALIEALLKALLLALIWLFFAIMLVLAATSFAMIVGIAYVLDTILSINICVSIKRLEVSGDITLNSGYNIDEVYIDFLDLKIPTIETYFGSERFAYISIISLFLIEFEFTEFPEDFWGQSSESISPQSSTSTPFLSDNSQQNIFTLIHDDPVNFFEFFIGIMDGMALSGAVYSIAGFIYAPSKDELRSFIFGTALTVGGFLLYLWKIALVTDNIKKGLALTGLGLGFIIMGIIALLTGTFRGIISAILAVYTGTILGGLGEPAVWVAVLTTIDVIFAIVGFSLDLVDTLIPLMELYPIYITDIVLGLTGGITGALIGIIGLLTFSIRLDFYFGILVLILGFILLSIGGHFINQGIDEMN